MAISTETQATVNGTHTDSKPLELAIDLPRSPGLKLNLHLTILANSILLFLTSTDSDALPNSAVQMGSFVYALPDRYNPSQPMSTALYTAPSSLDFTTRMAKVLTRKLAKPCYSNVAEEVMESETKGFVITRYRPGTSCRDLA
ncbi:hypothetical protein CKM354_000993300 [Cercospora kikuchii]|uniref:Uncharacterized protein n=1 Tax=Cercospora kikuchii TaxID=84275 RepID=A0A9P3CLR7_9PEZI|nr:uncharacterized protein CKM354_000993300 [Cercospora kikuchii]GIZ46824.1 hypothetical protein CKM354_000993300 [Cercospora kikuchii]